MKRVLINIIKAYKSCLSPYIIRSCRYYPSCSDYAIEAVEHYGALKGAAMAIKRLLRCHPFAAGGFDPVQKKERESL